MAHDEPRAVVRPVQLGSHHGAHVPYTDLHGGGGGPLRLSGDVDRGPGQDERGRGVDAPRGEEDGEVAHAGPRHGVGVAEEDRVPDGGEDGRAPDEDGALPQTLG